MTQFKISRFTNIVREENYLLHNTLFNTVIGVYSDKHKKILDMIMEGKCFKKEDINDDAFFDVLLINNMIVNSEENEYTILNSMYEDKVDKGVLMVTLVVTRFCNFKCPYCYEQSEKKSMSKELYMKVIDYIFKRVEKENFNSVNVTFFGGEPTIEHDNIAFFMDELHLRNEKLEKPVYIYGGIVSNGYLLKEEIIDKFLKYNINYYQVTVDGFASSHNESRILLNGEGSWDRIIENLKSFKKRDENFTVQIRGNVTPKMYEDIDEWLLFLKENFGDDKRFVFHFEEAKNLGGMKDSTFELLKNEKDTIREIVIKARKIGLQLDLECFYVTKFSMICYAAKKNSVIIDFDGTLKRCTGTYLDTDKNNCGNIYEDMTMDNYKKIASWTSFDINETCYNCEILPICYGRKCPATSISKKHCELLRQTYYSHLQYLYGKN